MTWETEDGIPILESNPKGPTRLVDVCMVSHEQVPVGFTYDLGQLMGFTAANLPEGVNLGLNLVSGTYVHKGRQQMMESMRERGSTWVLWLDTDMRFPRDLLVQLMMHQQPVVGINYSQRTTPPDYVGIKRVGFGEEAEKLVTDDSSTGLEEVEALGFGALLIRGDVVQALPVDEPWFHMEWNRDHRDWLGEDVAFCRHVRNAGYRILADHDLSKQCAHIGQFEYKLEHVEAVQAHKLQLEESA